MLKDDEQKSKSGKMRIAFLRKTDYNIFKYLIGLHKHYRKVMGHGKTRYRIYITLHEEKNFREYPDSYKDLRLQSFLSGQGIEDVGRIMRP